jgi:very-short-patch-repair endonuclease
MNGDLEPRGVTRCNDFKAWFKCDTCPHSFEATISHITDGTWCPYCTEPVKKLCKDKSCHHCLLKSFASHPRADQWHPTENHPITPRDVARGSSTRKYWFKCDKCPHDFLGDLANISSSGQWCPYCRGNELCDATGCDFCFKKSFASHPKAIHWHPTMNGDLKPRDICMAANRKVWFNCDGCSNSIDIRVNHVSSRGGWCGICKNKTEKKIYQYLVKHYPEIKREFKVNWCKNPETDCYYPFDFCIKEKRLIIELDGKQHFEDVKYFKTSFKDRHAVDLLKQLAANENGFRVIRLMQEDVWSDKYDWLTELLNNIEDDTKQNVFMCKNGEYDFFSKSMEMFTSEGQHQQCSTSSL